MCVFLEICCRSFPSNNSVISDIAFFKQVFFVCSTYSDGQYTFLNIPNKTYYLKVPMIPNSRVTLLGWYMVIFMIVQKGFLQTGWRHCFWVSKNPSRPGGTNKLETQGTSEVAVLLLLAFLCPLFLSWLYFYSF